MSSGSRPETTRRRSPGGPRRRASTASSSCGEWASAAKIAATRGYGAAVDLEADGPSRAFDRLHTLIAETGRTLVHPFDDPLVIAGQGTVALELLEDAPEVETILVSAGGGGLIAGVAAAAPGRAHVIVVEPELSTAVISGLAAGRPCPSSPLHRGRPLGAVCRRDRARDAPAHGAETLLVTEGDRGAFRWLYMRAKLACEPAAAGAARPLLAGQIEDGRSVSLSRAATSRRRPPLLSWLGDEDRHPSRVRVRHVHCSCGNEFVTRSTKADLHVEICSACHPFYTGKQKLVDTGGRVERFQRRLEKAGGAHRG